MVGGDVLTTGTGDFEGAADAERLFALDADDRSVAWSVDVASTTFAPVIAGDVVYVVTTDGVEAVSIDGEPLDSVAIEDPLSERSPALGHGRLYVPTTNGVVAVE